MIARCLAAPRMGPTLPLRPMMGQRLSLSFPGETRASMSQDVNGELVPVGGGDPIPLIRAVMILGRRESCDIPLRFPNISGQHAEMSFRNGYWYIKDLNSTNGIKVNGNRVQEK